MRKQSFSPTGAAVDIVTSWSEQFHERSERFFFSQDDESAPMETHETVIRVMRRGKKRVGGAGRSSFPPRATTGNHVAAAGAGGVVVHVLDATGMRILRMLRECKVFLTAGQLLCGQQQAISIMYNNF